MGHHLTAFIGRRDVLERLPVPRLRLLALPQGLWLAPMPEALLRELTGERDMLPYERMDELAKAASAAGKIGWLMSDWFGGNGSTEVALWEGGRPLRATQDEMLSALGAVRVPPADDRSAFWKWLDRASGVKPRLLDEWDSLGLGNWRDTENAYELADPVNSQWTPDGQTTGE